MSLSPQLAYGVIVQDDMVDALRRLCTWYRLPQHSNVSLTKVKDPLGSASYRWAAVVQRATGLSVPALNSILACFFAQMGISPALLRLGPRWMVTV